MILEEHLNAIEKVLIAKSEIANNAGHPNLRGGPREWFIHEYLENHLPTIFEIGQGEIIDENSESNPSQDNYRPQVDLIIYRRDLPKITYSKNNSAFLSEGVKATLEIKSNLTKEDLEQACNASKVHKSLNRSVKNKIISYVVAYKGPENMKTVANWLKNSKIPTNDSVEMIIILGKGIIWKIDSFPEFSISNRESSHNWAYFDSNKNNIYALFTHMLTWLTLIPEKVDISNYTSTFYSQIVEVI